MEKIIGAFVFEDLGDGCLTGKWLNNSESIPYPESAKFKKRINESEDATSAFEGIYTTSWIEERDSVQFADLIIQKINSEIYKLEWRSGNKISFHGKAMMFKRMLIGTYWI